MVSHVPDFSPEDFPPGPVTDSSLQPNHSPGPRPPPGPFPPWPRPHYHYNHNQFVYATLTVLCFGSIALAVICWKCCRKTNKGTIKSSQGSIVSANIITLAEIPPPPPPPYTSTDDLYKSPPRYSGIFRRTDDIFNSNEKVQNKEEFIPYVIVETNYSPGSQIINMEGVARIK